MKIEKRCNLHDEDYTVPYIRNYFLMTSNRCGSRGFVAEQEGFELLRRDIL